VVRPLSGLTGASLCQVTVASADFGLDVVGEFEGGLVAGG
jgi:hypothetical protein